MISGQLIYDTRAIPMILIFTSERENESKMKEADLIKAKATITELQHKIYSVETSRKRQRIEMEQDIESIKQESAVTMAC